MEDNMQTLRKTLTASVEAKANGIVAKLTTDSVDRDGEVLIPQGMVSKDFEKNPVLFYNHEYDQPVGKVTNLKRTDNAVFGTLTFAKRPDGYQGEFFPEFIEALIQQDIVKGVSVGFVPEVNGSRAATKADRAKFGTGIKRVFNRWKLLEVSIAPLPANQDALIQAVGKGLVTAVQCKSFLGVEVPETKMVPKLIAKRRYKIKLRGKGQEDLVAKAVNKEVSKRMGRLYE
jgi:HK97 family phage prohead protease